jgi:endonuclease/exonuclease/phosphatase family metal-dependent hydrolase
MQYTDAPRLEPGQSIKVMTYNVQYMASKQYVFFYDVPGFSGPDRRPSRAAIETTLREVARVIVDEAPDFVLLQEVDDGAKRTDYEDQLQRLQALLGAAYPCAASVFYWRVPFLPYPKIWGSVGMKQCILSRYRIRAVARQPLAVPPANLLLRPFLARRSILQAFVPIRNGPDLVMMNTHLEAFGEGTGVMQRQVEQVAAALAACDDRGQPWIIGGDFNLLPAGQHAMLAPAQQAYYNPQTELARLYADYDMIPALADLQGADAAQWTTYFGNDPALSGPDRTLDYLFYSQRLHRTHSYVRRHDTLAISDHLPVIGEFTLAV